MKIGIEAQRLFRKRKHGMDIVVLEQLRMLQLMDTAHQFIVYVKPGPDRCLLSSANMTVREIRMPSYPLWEQFALPRAAREDGVDILHCTSNTAPLYRSPLTVLTLHDVIFMEQGTKLGDGRTLYQRFGNWYRRWNVPKVVAKASRVITVSDYERGCIDAVFPEIQSRLRVAHNAVSNRFTASHPEEALIEARQRYRLPDRYLLFLGNTDPKKNLTNILKGYAEYAASAEAPVKLVVLDLDEETLEMALTRAGLPKDLTNFHLPGYVDHGDMPKLYTLAEAFLYPSVRESFGLPIIEAMASGTVVITSDAAAMPEIAGDAALLVDPTRPADLADMIHFILASPAVSRTLIARGFKRSRDFSWENSALTLLSIYEELESIAATEFRKAA